MTDFASCNIEAVDVREVWSSWATTTTPEMSASVQFMLESPTAIGATPSVQISFSLDDIDNQTLDQIEARFLEASLTILRRLAGESLESLREHMIRSRATRPPV